MRNFFKNKPLMIAACAAGLLLILAAFTAGDRTTTIIESAAGSVFKPAESFASKASGAIIDFVQRVLSTTEADQENKQLKVHVSQLEQSLSELEALKQENSRLKDLLNYAETMPELSRVSGSVIAYSQGIWFDTFTINLGRNHGVEKNMPVVNAKGLVGRVTQVGASSSKVVALIDSSMSVSVMVERTRDSGMVRGTLNTGNSTDRLDLYYLPADADLLPGDKIVTSGVGGIYPKGLIVGYVFEVSHSGETDSNAVVQPVVDFRHIEEIAVIIGVPSEVSE